MQARRPPPAEAPRPPAERLERIQGLLAQTADEIDELFHEIELDKPPQAQPQGSGERQAVRSPQALCANVDMRQCLSAFAPGFVSGSGFLIFSKDVAEGVLAEALALAGFEPDSAPLSFGVAALTGTWYGLTHQFVSRLTTGLLNARLALPRWTADAATESERQWWDFCAATVPNVLTYSTFHLVRGYLTIGIADPMQVAAIKLVTSAIASAASAMITNYLQQRNAAHFKQSRSAPTTIENLKGELRSLCADMSARKLGRDYVGKALASPLALMAAVPLTPEELPGAIGSDGRAALQAGLSKLIFQSGFFIGVHIGGAAGEEIDQARRASARGKPFVEAAGNDERLVALDEAGQEDAPPAPTTLLVEASMSDARGDDMSGRNLAAAESTDPSADDAPEASQ